MDEGVFRKVELKSNFLLIYIWVFHKTFNLQGTKISFFKVSPQLMHSEDILWY